MTVRPAKHRNHIGNVAIIGGGIIGLSCAWELADRGLEVDVIDSGEIGRGASWAAAGMLAPAFEAVATTQTHHRLFELCMRSSLLWADFSARLSEASGRDVGYVSGPALAVAKTEDEASMLGQIAAQLATSKVAHSLLSATQVRTIEPALSDQLAGGLSLASDGQIDNRAVVTALISVCQRHPRIKLHSRSSVANADRLCETFEHVVCAAGWESRDLLGEAEMVVPVGGQMLATARTHDSPRHTIRHGDVYIAPKADRIVIGATVETGLPRPVVRATEIAALKARAAELCPVLGRAPTIETWSGTRPGSPDHAPLIGATSRPGIWVATGHYRNGILLAPITAEVIADYITVGDPGELASEFSPQRFSRAGADAPTV